MKIAAALASGLLLAAGSALAALPPFYDGAHQIQTILEDGAVYEAVKGAPVEGVESLGRNAEGNPEWRIRAGDCAVTVEIGALPMPEGMVGRVDYEVFKVGACE